MVEIVEGGRLKRGRVVRVVLSRFVSERDGRALWMRDSTREAPVRASWRFLVDEKSGCSFIAIAGGVRSGLVWRGIERAVEKDGMMARRPMTSALAFLNTLCCAMLGLTVNECRRKCVRSYYFRLRREECERFICVFC